MVSTHHGWVPSSPPATRIHLPELRAGCSPAGLTSPQATVLSSPMTPNYHTTRLVPNDPLPGQACQVPGVDPKPTLPPAPSDTAGQDRWMARRRRSRGNSERAGRARDEKGMPSARHFCAPICCSPRLLWRGQAALLPTWSLTLFIQMAPISQALRLLPFSRKTPSGLFTPKPSSFTQTSKSTPSSPPEIQRKRGKAETGRERWGFHLSRGLLSSPRI